MRDDPSHATWPSVRAGAGDSSYREAEAHLLAALDVPDEDILECWHEGEGAVKERNGRRRADNAKGRCLAMAKVAAHHGGGAARAAGPFSTSAKTRPSTRTDQRARSTRSSALTLAPYGERSRLPRPCGSAAPAEQKSDTSLRWLLVPCHSDDDDVRALLTSQ